MLKYLIVVATLTVMSTVALADDTSDCRTKRGGDAMAACDRVIDDPSTSKAVRGDTLINRGQQYYERDEYDRALKDFTEAILLKPRYLDLAYGNRGNVYFAKGETSMAIENYTRALEINSEFPSAYASRGMLYEKLGDIAKARTDYRAALKSDSIYGDTKWAHDTARQALKRLDDN